MKIRLVTGWFVMLLAACSSPSSRIDDNRTAYDSYPPEVQQKIKAGQVDVGFTREQAKLALGEPDRKYTRTTERGGSEIWAYTQTSPTFGFGFGTGVPFGRGGGGYASTGVTTSTGDGNEEDKLRLVFVEDAVTSIEKVVK